jgi:hypothetical protein
MKLARNIIDRLEGRERMLKIIIVVLIFLNMGLLSFTGYIYLNKKLKKK